MRRELCDVTLTVDDQSFLAHRIILASAIPYFRVLFMSSMTEKSKKEFYFENLQPKAVESLINYAYGNDIEISEDDVLSLLVASDFMQVEEIRNACGVFLAERLDPNNIVEISNVADCVNQRHLIQRSLRYVRNHFDELSKRDDFTELPYDYFKTIIGSDILYAQSEEAVFEMVVKWVKASPSDRQTFLPELLSQVRMTLLTVNFFQNRVESETLITSSTLCRELVEAVKNYHSKQQSGVPSLKVTPRKLLKDGIVYVVSKNSTGCSVHYCYPHAISETMWNSLGNSSGVWNFAILYVAVMNEKIYAFLTKSTQIFDLRAQEWEVVESRMSHGAAFVLHSNVVYCFGSEESDFRRAIRHFDTQQNKWVKHGKMDRELCNSSAASLDEWIYITGGSGNLYRAQKYNPATCACERIASMPGPVFFHSSTSANGKLYVLGYGESSWWDHGIKTGLMYDPNIDRWNFIASLNAMRPHTLSLIPSFYSIFALGLVIKCTCTYYCSECEASYELQQYDLEDNKWKSVFLLPASNSFPQDSPVLAVCNI